MAKPWYVIVERSDRDTGEKLPDYAVGPYTTLKAANEECQSDSGTIFCLVTDDAKKEQYIAEDCYCTQDKAEDAIVLDVTE